MAVIDIGPASLADWGASSSTGETQIDLINPANLSGNLDTLQIYFSVNYFGDATNVEIGTFYGSGNSWTSRDSHYIGNVTAPGLRTFTGITCDVEAGDCIGAFWNTEWISCDSSGGGGGFEYKTGNQFGAGTQTYSNNATWQIAIRGDGTESSSGWANIAKLKGATATDLAKVNGAAVADIAKLLGVAV